MSSIWSPHERMILRPPEKLTVSQWADRYRFLTAKESAEAGCWHTDRTPYLREIMDTCGSRRVNEVVIMKPVQAGLSEAARNLLGYWCDQDPGPTMLVLPDEKSGRAVIEERIRPLFENSPRLRQYLPSNPRDMTLEVCRLRTMEIYLAWAGSAQSLASRPCRYVIFDEVDKYPDFAGRDADPIALGEARTRTYDYRRTTIKISTPTLNTRGISMAYELCGDQRAYWFRCLHCHDWHIPNRACLGWPEKGDDQEPIKHAEQINDQQLAWYACPLCGAIMSENDRQIMVRRGEWRSNVDDAERSRKVGFQFNALVNPWTSVHTLAAKWIKVMASKNIGALMEYINQELGEPFEEAAARPEKKVILAHINSDIEYRMVPDWARRLIITVDTQKDHFWYVARAWGPNMRSRLIDYGKVITFKDLLGLLNHKYPIHKSSKFMLCHVMLIDAGGGTPDVDVDGSLTDDVYRFTQLNRRIVAIKGHGGNRKPEKRIRKVTDTYRPPGSRQPYKVDRYVIDTHHYKDVLHDRMNDADRSLWELPREVGKDYMRHMQSEHKVPQRRGLKMRLIWKTKGARTPNHLWDCEVYQCAGAVMLGLEKLVDDNSDLIDPQETHEPRTTRNTTRRTTRWKVGR